VTLTWKLVRVSLWVAIAAFVLAAGAGLMEDYGGWSDDPRWDAFAIGAVLTCASLVAGIVARIVASVRKQKHEFPTRLTIVTIAVGAVIFVVQVITHLGPMGVV
jgi:hypothetical protein